MKKFDGVLLVSDFDDTLYNSKLKVSPENLEAIRYFMENGGRFTVATGRAHNAFAAQTAVVPLNAPVVLSNGSSIYDFQKDEYVIQTYLAPSVREDCGEIIAAVPEIGFEAYHGEEVYAFHPNAVTERHSRRVGIRYTAAERPEDIPLSWSKVIFEQELDILERVEALVKRRWPEKYEIIFSNRYLLEMTDRDSNKGKMVLRIADALGIRPENIYCVGDNKNDIPMLEISAIPFAPANAAPAVKEMGARVVGSSDEHCIRDVVTILDERYR